MDKTSVVKTPIKRTWWKESTVYQIYPASFKSGNGTTDPSTGLVRGDLRGIISQLDYLATLGVDIVWLSPILQSPQVDMGYDISDYRQIYPGYGTMEDHDEMIKGMHDRGIKYVMDLVVNHSSDQHDWFKQSRSSKDNPYRDWFVWRPPRYSESGERIPPNNWESAFSGPAWTYDDATGEYYLHLFASGQPDLNWENPKVVSAVHDIIRFWLDRGVDGFRMDVINFISKTPGLPDADIKKPGFLQNGIQHYACGPRLHEFLAGIGSILLEYDAFSVGEMPGVYDTREILKAIGQGRGELAMAFQFEVVDMDIAENAPNKWYNRPFDPSELKTIVSKWNTFMLNNAGWNAVFMENHDQGRTVSRYADDRSDEARLRSAKLIAAHMALQSGTPFVYQGQELAQINVPESWGMDEYKDIEVLNHWKTVLEEYPDDLETQAKFRAQYRLIGRDNARTPMQWTSDEKTFAGFLPANTPPGTKPWMSIHPDYQKWNAAVQVADDDSAFHYWRRLLALRKEFKELLIYGDFEMLDVDNHFPHVIAYVRTDDAINGVERSKCKRCLVIANFSHDAIQWTIPTRVQGILIDESGSLRKGAIVPKLRNYGVQAGENQVQQSADGQWAFELRPWEVIVALQ